MKVVYDGACASVYLSEQRVFVEKGSEVDLPADVVKELVECGEWNKPAKNQPAGEEE